MRSDRKIILNEAWLPSVDLLIFDEIHKMQAWKNYLKGVYDTKPAEQKILVTGSARLEIFNHVGDSLAGRFFLHRLLPLSPEECEREHAAWSVDRFLARGGFPEPFLTQELADSHRWRSQYIQSLLTIDILDFDHIRNLKTLKLIYELLRQRVGSPISYTSIAEDVAASPTTVKKYIEALEALYIVFRVTPFSRNIARSVLKEPKIYFFDTGAVNRDEGAKFENFVATCLLKHLLGLQDSHGENYALHYLLTKEKKEVDFAIIKDEQPEKLIEVKFADSAISPSLRYFHTKYGIPAVQLLKELKHERIDQGIEVRRASNFLTFCKISNNSQ